MPNEHEEQYKRVKRWYKRLSDTNAGRTHDLPSDYLVDEIHAFFMACYHLKDWIKNDPAAPHGMSHGVESYVTSERSLRLCADMCISLKHLTLRHPRSFENPKFGRKAFRLTLGGGRASIGLRYEIETDNGPIDAFELATQCVAAWESYLGRFRPS